MRQRPSARTGRGSANALATSKTEIQVERVVHHAHEPAGLTLVRRCDAIDDRVGRTGSIRFGADRTLTQIAEGRLDLFFVKNLHLGGVDSLDHLEVLGEGRDVFEIERLDVEFPLRFDQVEDEEAELDLLARLGPFGLQKL